MAEHYIHVIDRTNAKVYLVIHWLAAVDHGENITLYVFPVSSAPVMQVMYINMHRALDSLPSRQSRFLINSRHPF